MRQREREREKETDRERGRSEDVKINQNRLHQVGMSADSNSEADLITSECPTKLLHWVTSK